MLALPLDLAMFLIAELRAATPFRITFILPALPPIFLALLGHARIAPLRLDTQSWRLDDDLSMRQRRHAHKCECGQGNTDFPVRSFDPITVT